MKRERISALIRYIVYLLILAIVYVMTSSVWVISCIVLLILISLCSWLLNFLLRKKLKVKIKLTTTTSKNTEITGKIKVENTSLLPCVRLYCKLILLNDLTLEKEAVWVSVSVKGKGAVEKEFSLISTHSGRLYIYADKCTLMDYFGILPIKASVKASARVTVLPDMFSVDAEVSAMPRTSEEGVSDKRGDDRTEIFQLREYEKGDDVRLIHWKLSSKLDELILKEPAQPISRSLLIFWDKRCIGSPDVMDTLSEAVSSISQGILDSGVQFDICWTEKDDIEKRSITTGDELLQTIPELLKFNGSENCPDPDYEGYAKVLYFSAEVPECAENEGFTLFICSETGEEIENAFAFSPLDYGDKLQRLEI